MKSEKLRILLVDDEYLIRSLLRRCIEWSGIPCEVVEELGSAKEALDYLEKEEVDVIFSDICMPNMDGIQFAQIVLKEKPDLKLIFLTGHAEFNYAQKSIELGVFEFILKPINDEEIKAILQKVYNKIQEEKWRKEDYERLKQQIEQGRPYLRQHFLNELLQGRVDGNSIEEAGISEEWVKEKAAFYEVNLELEGEIAEEVALEGRVSQKVSPLYQVVIIEIEEWKKRISEYDTLLDQAKISEEILLKEPKLQRHLIFTTQADLIILMKLQETEVVCYESLEHILEWLKLSYGYKITIGIGNAYKGLYQIVYSYKEALEAIAYKVVMGENQIIQYSDLLVSRESRDLGEESLRKYLEQFDWQPFERALLMAQQEMVQYEIERIWAQISKDYYQSRTFEIKFLAISLLNALMHVLLKAELSLTDIIGTGDRGIEGFLEVKTLPVLKEFLEDWTKQIIEHIKVKLEDNSQEIITRVKRYIKENLGDGNLTLGSIATAFYMNPSYLSRLFKQKAGEGLCEYITRIRLEKALELIRTTELKAYEIAESVGIYDPHYFSTLFKKATGKSFLQYKKSLQGE